MKNVPDIAPEIRGLLEEIVADPLSAIRLAPRRALRTWFDTGETVRASDVTRTKAERHLVEVHREELAVLLREASWIAYWKAPVLSYRPVGEDGQLYDPTVQEPEWRLRAAREVASPSASPGVDLLRHCLDGIMPQQGSALAQASLALVPNDTTRFNVALHAQWKKPRTAIALFARLLARSPAASLKPVILLHLGAQTCHLGLFVEAHRLYRAASALDPQSPYAWGCAFNLSCVNGNAEHAREEAAKLDAVVTPEDPRILDLRDLLQQWRKARGAGGAGESEKVIHRLQDRLPRVAKVLSEDPER